MQIAHTAPNQNLRRQLIITDREKAALNELLVQIKTKEAECLNTIHARFCLLRGIKINLADINRMVFPDRPNYWEYYYRHGKPDEFFLMSRDVFVEDEMPKLNVVFNAKLLTDKD